jgi:diketogulonate reductase-like aldo/keto reductase
MITGGHHARASQKGTRHGDHQQGVAMSRLGFGTFRMPGAAAQSVVESALALG